jgi:hypothetical protein
MAMIGLGRVKSELANMIQVARENYQRELRGEPKVDLQLNRVFIGNPGTGKGGGTLARMLRAHSFPPFTPVRKRAQQGNSSATCGEKKSM